MNIKVARLKVLNVKRGRACGAVEAMSVMNFSSARRYICTEMLIIQVATTTLNQVGVCVCVSGSAVIHKELCFLSLRNEYT